MLAAMGTMTTTTVAVATTTTRTTTGEMEEVIVAGDKCKPEQWSI
jgi:hypothetical protein